MSDQEILRQRAAVLARREREVVATVRVDHAVFRLAREAYAIEVAALKQIFPLRDLARLPGARAPLIGLTAWRGGLLRVIDLLAALGRTQGGIADQGRVLVIGQPDAGEFGVLVDAVEDVIQLSDEDVKAAPSGETNSLVRGVTRDAVLVLDAPEMLRRFG